MVGFWFIESWQKDKNEKRHGATRATSNQPRVFFGFFVRLDKSEYQKKFVSEYQKI